MTEIVNWINREHTTEEEMRVQNKERAETGKDERKETKGKRIRGQ